MKVHFTTLGCPKNQVDSELMLGMLARAGHEIADAAETADCLVVNTCAFIDRAKQESVDAILEMAALKKMSRDGQILPFNLALVHLGLGDRARALDNLEGALAADSQMMAWIGRDAIFDPIRSEPRFAALLNKMGVNH